MSECLYSPWAFIHGESCIRGLPFKSTYTLRRRRSFKQQSVNSSADLINKLKKEKVKAEAQLVSFDVTGVFPNISLRPTLEYAEKFLGDVNKELTKDLWTYYNNYV